MSVGTLNTVMGFTLKEAAGHTRWGPDYGEIKAGGEVAGVRPRPGSKGGVQGPNPCNAGNMNMRRRGRTKKDQTLGSQERPRESVTLGPGAGEWVCFQFLWVMATRVIPVSALTLSVQNLPGGLETAECVSKGQQKSG